MAWLGRGLVEGAERDIVGALLARLHREVAAVVAGAADLRVGAEDRAGLLDVPVRLAEVNPVGAEPLGQRDAVVDDEGDVRVGADALQRLGEARQLMVFDVLDAKLEGGRNARARARPSSGLETRRQPLAG